MRYYVGIDGGGTKTLFKCADEKLNEIKTLSFPSCHVLQVEQNQAIEILKNGISQIIDGLPDNDIEICICAGLAGYGNDQSIRKRIEMIASEAFQGKPFILYNDAQVALAGALNNEDGILVIAGTGSIALSKDSLTYSLLAKNALYITKLDSKKSLMIRWLNSFFCIKYSLTTPVPAKTSKKLRFSQPL